jgi:hypothetical protein
VVLPYGSTVMTLYWEECGTTSSVLEVRSATCRFRSLQCLVQNPKTTVECTHGTNSTYMFEGRGNHLSIINKCYSDRMIETPDG